MPPKFGRDKDPEYDGSVNDSVDLGKGQRNVDKRNVSTNYKPSLLKP
jgi:hypothetical protein